MSQRIVNSQIVCTYKSIQFEHFELILNSKDCCCLLKTGNFAKVIEICICENKIFLTAKIYSCLKPLAGVSHEFDLQFGSFTSEPYEIKVVFIHDILSKCVRYFNYSIALVHYITQIIVKCSKIDNVTLFFVNNILY